MKLSTLAILLGLGFGLPQLFGLLNPSKFREAMRQFPRSETWGYGLMVLGTGCCDSTAPYLYDRYYPGSDVVRAGAVAGVPVFAHEWLARLYGDGELVVDVDEAFAQRGWDSLFRIFPALGSLPGLRFATYAGFRQDVGDQPGVPKCERMEAVPNVIAALPSGLLGAWPVAMRATALVAEITIEKRPQPTIPVAVMGARVGDNHEDAGGTEWSAEPPQG